MSFRALAGFVVASVWFVGGTAQAGPVEVLDGVSIVPGQPRSLMVRYRNQGGGIFVSHDQGASFGLVCNSAVDESVQREASAAIVRSDGSILLGVFDGLWQGDRDACDWTSTPAFEGQWLNDFARDPLDDDRIYAITSAGGKQNGIFVNSVGSDTWTAVGAQEEVLINRMQMVALGKTGVRFYQSIVRGEIEIPAADGGIAERLPNYVIRHSDDMAKTWIEHEFGQTDGTLRLLGADPTDPDRIVVGVLRGEVGIEALPDEILWSADKGKSFEKVGEVGELGGIELAPDGRMFYGDHFQSTPGLYVVPALGDEPKLLSNEYKVGCLGYDAQTGRLYVCQDTLFGLADPATGAFSQLYDIKHADTFGSCGGEGAVQSTCRAQLSAGYCGVTHYFCTPLCAEYEVRDNEGKLAADSKLCNDGGEPTTSADAGSEPTGKPDAGSDKPESKGDSGCGVTAPVGSNGVDGPGLLALCVGLLVWTRAHARIRCRARADRPTRDRLS